MALMQGRRRDKESNCPHSTPQPPTSYQEGDGELEEQGVLILKEENLEVQRFFFFKASSFHTLPW